tara:strand:+ start:323 stop:466 length:144 start_codon:yes stop_codon:yes gene_type:complete
VFIINFQNFTQYPKENPGAIRGIARKGEDGIIKDKDTITSEEQPQTI